MSDEEKNAVTAAAATSGGVPQEQPFLDEHTTEPNAPASRPEPPPSRDGWQMPKPKFQQTSGYLPQGYLKNIEQGAGEGNPFPGSEDTTQEQAAFVPSPPPAPEAAADPVAVEPQPDLVDQLIPEDPDENLAHQPAASKSGSSGVMVVLAVIAIVVFVVAFLAAVYFLFLANPSSGDNF